MLKKLSRDKSISSVLQTLDQSTLSKLAPRLAKLSGVALRLAGRGYDLFRECGRLKHDIIG